MNNLANFTPLENANLKLQNKNGQNYRARN